MDTQTNFPALFSPVTIRGKTFRNRFAASPQGGMGACLTDPTPEEAEALLSHTHGVAMTVIGETDVSAEGGRMPEAGDTDFTDLSEENLYGWRKRTELLHEHVDILLIQLCHCGASIVADTGHPVYGPVDEINQGGVHVHAMDEAVMARTCEDFANAAYFMKMAGFDGIQFHFGHGWLCTQFLSPISNTRTDEYGGSLANRARFPLRIIKAVREKVGEDFLLDMRFSGEEMCPGGYTVEDAVEFCKMADPYLDLINISEGHYRDPIATRQFPGMFHERGCNAQVSAKIKAAVSHAMVSVVGAINSPEVADRIVREGKADFLYLGRQLTSDPCFVEKLAQGREKEILPCALCFGCFPGPAEEATRPDEDGIPGLANLGCPNSIPEGYVQVPPIRETKRVLVVGGGIGGMIAGAIAAERGHTVLLIEKTDRLGGILNCVRPDPHKEGFSRMLDARKYRLEKSGAEIRLNTEISPALVQDFAPDVIWAAVGAYERREGIPGVEAAMPAVGAMGRLNEIGQHVIIIGGGLIGSELAVFLKDQGREVTLVVRSVLARTAPKMHRKALKLKLDEGVRVLKGYKTLSVTASTAAVETAEGLVETLEADTVISALGLESNVDAVAQIRVCAGDIPVEVFGDCVKPGKIYDAKETAIRLASLLATDYDPPAPKPMFPMLEEGKSMIKGVKP